MRFSVNENVVIGGIILHPFSAIFSRVPTLENYNLIKISENEALVMTLQTGNVPGTIPLFPGDDAGLTEKVRLRLLQTGKLIQAPTPQAESSITAELTIIAQLVRIDTTPECGSLHVGVVAEYTDLTILSGAYPYDTIFVIHGCPELKRSDYAQGSGDLVSFVSGDYHELQLTRQDVYGISFRPTGNRYIDERLFYSREVNLYH